MDISGRLIPELGTDNSALRRSSAARGAPLCRHRTQSAKQRRMRPRELRGPMLRSFLGPRSSSPGRMKPSCMFE
eukprot:12936528-Alexandrium_andersonii.AAC.1